MCGRSYTALLEGFSLMGKRYVIREENDYSAAGGCLALLIFIIAFAVYLFFTILPFIAAFAAGFIVLMLAEHILIEYKASVPYWKLALQ